MCIQYTARRYANQICKSACAIVRAGAFIDHEISTGKPYCQKINGYSILVAEFLPEGALTDHLIQSGTNAGKMNTKQDWSMFMCTV